MADRRNGTTASIQSRLWRLAQPLLLIATLYYVGRTFARRWDAVSEAASQIQLNWFWIILSCIVVFVTYAVLIESWRFLIRVTGGQIRYGKAMQIWFAANLGRYLPGRIWSIGALGVLAQREGVAPWIAASAAVVGTLLNIGAGFAVTAVSAADSLQALTDWNLREGAIAGALVFLITLLLLPWVLPLLVRLISRIRGAGTTIVLPDARSVWIVALVNVASWFMYGLGFALLAKGAVPGVTGSPLLFTAVFTASYVAGYLFLFAPGGIGVREVILQTLLVSFGMADMGNAILLALISRLWLTALEILPGLAGALLLSLAGRQKGLT